MIHQYKNSTCNKKKKNLHKYKIQHKTTTPNQSLTRLQQTEIAPAIQVLTAQTNPALRLPIHTNR